MTSEHGTAGENEPELQRYARILRQRRAVLVAVLAVGGLGFGAWALTAPRIYEATATVLADATPPKVLGQEVRDVVDIGPGQYLFMQDYMQTQKRVLTSDSLARRVIDRLRLQRDHEFWRGLEQPLANDADAAPDELVAAFVRAISVEAVARTQIINVSFRHRSPQVAKRVVDRLVDCYVERNLEARDTTTHQASQWLADQADDLRERLVASERAVFEFKRDNDLLSLSLEDRINNESQRIDKLAAALTDARLKRAARNAEAVELAHLADADAATATLLGEGAGAGALEQMKRELLDEERKLSELQSRYEDAHPLVRQEQAKLAAVRAAMAREAAVQVKAARARAAEAESEEKQIAAQLDQAKQEGMRVARLELDYNKLKREAEALNKQYSLVANRTKETELSSKIKVNNLHVLDYARVPDAPRSPRRLVGAAVALASSPMLGLILALLLDALDRSLKDQNDIEVKLGLPLLGTVPKLKEGEQGLVAIDSRSPASEYFRMIRTSLLFAGVSRRMHRVLVTSAAPSEGKTMVAMNLAAVTAQAGQRVLLIDCDLRAPRLSNAFGQSNAKGLMNVVIGAATLDQVIQPTAVPNLYLLPCGPLPPDPAELITQPRFREVLDECAARFERVFIDSPPAAPVTDPVLLASACDGVMLVARAHRTRSDLLRRAVRSLAGAGVPVLGVVFNEVAIADSYGSSYGYGYGYGAGKKDKKSKRAA